ncbi:hypothetical protein [Nocardia sp. CC227C]|uniref:hypothetical protein n=1 Tax=Nocardia sp. CC227C TaxID=3044562 RepID=UPI00278BC9CE|nr:hypothetical protein [Nocardia sp. CC227C]
MKRTRTIRIAAATTALAAALAVGPGLAAAAPTLEPAPAEQTLTGQDGTPVVLELFGYSPLQAFLACLTTGSFDMICRA